MATSVRFLKAADNTRPYKCHRYDVFGLKIDRNVTLFGRVPLNTWITLEADPCILSYCERPLLVPDVKPKRIIDFWVRFRDHEELWIVKRQSEAADDSLHEAMPAFTIWAASSGMPVRFIDPIDQIERPTYLDNWGRILRELSANRRFVSAKVIERVRQSITSPRPITALISMFPDDDPVLLRTAAYSLIHAGQLRCSDIERQPLGPTSLLEIA